MQFNAENGTRKNAIQTVRDLKTKESVGKTSWKVGINVSMYHDPPQENITLNEFDEIAQERLSVLKFLEEMKERHAFGSDEYNKALEKRLVTTFPIATQYNAVKDMPGWRRRDVIGHFILRLAFCRNPEQTKWLINQEVDFFRYRFKHLSQLKKIQEEFLRNNNINIHVLSSEEQKELDSLLSRSFGTLDAYSHLQNYYKLPFTDALDLVRRRKVLLRNGMAYIHNEGLVSALCGLLRTQMMATMTRAFKQLGMLEEENRILPRLTRLANNAYTGKIYEGDTGEHISRHQIDQLCATSFPPCMKQVHQRLRAEHHLRHGARRQYGLFLKGIGLSLEEAMAFMREEFTKKIDSDKFEKEYAYNIRHMYGKEGKRSAYHAFPCSTIILSNPPASGDCHGCPFKHNEPALLAQRLAKENLSKEQVNQIMELSKTSAYDKACTRFFEFSHKMENGALGHLITHPNQFYELSKEVNSGTRARDNHLHISHFQSQPAEERTPNPRAVKPSPYNPMSVVGLIDDDDF